MNESTACAGVNWDGLAGVQARIAPHFRRREARERARRYVEGLLGRVERKNGWQLAEALGEGGPQGMQRLLNAADWDAEAMRDDLQAYVVEHLRDERSGVLVIDETGFLKQGPKSAGVARPYRGTAGRRENQQIGVFLLSAAERGAALLDRALYLPDEWMGDAARRAEAHIPAPVGCATTGELARDLARDLVARAVAAGVPARWVGGDTASSGDEVRRWLDGQGHSYVLAVPSTHGLWTRGRQVSVEHWVNQVPADAWVRRSAGEGSQGPRWYAWACLALPDATATGTGQWLLARRSVSDPSELASYRVLGPADTPVGELVRVAGRRWTIAEGFEHAQGAVGLDQYEVRRYAAWQRHITLALLAHAYLEVTRLAALGASPAGAAREGPAGNGGELPRT